MNEINGSEGRWGRIESKLDQLIDDFGDFRVDTATRLTRLEASKDIQAQRQHDARERARLSLSRISLLIGATSVLGGTAGHFVGQWIH